MGQLSTRQKRRNFKMRLWRKSRCCFYCRKIIANPNEGTLDHVIPLCRGGLDSPRNLVLACLPCNKKKSDKIIIERIPMKTTELLADIAISRAQALTRKP